MKKLSAITMVLLVGIFGINTACSDDDWEDRIRYSTGVKLLENPVYKKECGDCHMAYHPGLLPAASWQKLMAGLEDHFDDNAELDKELAQQITQFLLDNSADKSDYRRSRHFRNMAREKVVIRITELPYFIHEHDEIPARLVSGNKEVNSFSHCNACHKKAEQASFREHDIFIPGYGKWDD
ncbi:MAG: diheme cytochrome c [Gammaproteobacteria bacterium]|nr:diheme cytochrome c [Gammaproteobacteria bacterium]